MEEIHQTRQKQYPFCAIVGQEEMKLALILNVINPNIGGVLIRGEKGTAKSTAVRALAEVLGERDEIDGCMFSCDPNNPVFWCEACRSTAAHSIRRSSMRVVDLPISATEDRVVGTLDMEHALKHGKKRFEPGILAAANRNILYVDEVNLLDDHIVDILLDSAAMGVNSIEREGISFSHPARFVLVGTMNPEEGDLRPQLIDRFGLVVDVRGEKEAKRRMEVVKRRLAFEADSESFLQGYHQEQETLKEQIRQAERKLAQVTYSDRCLLIAADIAIRLEVDGHRADITLIKTAMTHAAFSGRTKVTEDDLLVASRLALPHRMRRRPFEEGTVDLENVREIISSYGTV